MKTFLLPLIVVSSALIQASMSEKLDCTAEHNAVRQKHGVPNLKPSNEVFQEAQNRANDNARRDQMTHEGRTNPNKFGENLWWTPKGQSKKTCKEIVDVFYNEISKYNFNNPPQQMDWATGHFTQVVWKSTQFVGCANAVSKTGNTYIACSYNPPGNYPGKFKENVPPPTSG